MSEQATQADLGQVLGALTRPRTPQRRALRRLAAAIQAFSDAMQTSSTPLQVRVHVFCDPRGRPARPALDVTCQALTEQQLEQASAAGQWEEREQIHNWSPGQLPWEVAGRTPGRYRSRLIRDPSDRLVVLLRLDADAAFYPPSGDKARQAPWQPKTPSRRRSGHKWSDRVETHIDRT